jgi:hypothetical protein
MKIPEDIEMFERFEGFDYTAIAFSVNFIRPNFFGLEAFAYVQALMSELGLFALNLQSGSDDEVPRVQTAEEYYANWSDANLKVSADHFDEFELMHFPLERSNEYWRYNFHRNEIQEQLGDDYYAPSLFLARQASTGRLITLSTWTEHIPNVFPPADFFMLSRKKRKLFRTIEENGVISRERLMSVFGDYLDRFDFKDCFIIHPDKAERAAHDFNNIAFDAAWEGFFGEPVDLSRVSNALPQSGSGNQSRIN